MMTEPCGEDRHPGRERQLGVFPGDDYDLESISAVDEWLGGSLDIVVTFVQASIPREHREAFRREVLTPVWQAGYTPLVTWEPCCLDSEASRPPADQLRERGLLRQWAETLAEWAGPSPGTQRKLLVRPCHEMNGSWYPWSASEGVSGQQYVDGPPDETLSWVWCVNAESTAELTLADYYPGDSRVDLVGVDGFNWGASQHWSQWQQPEEVFADAFETVRAFADRPLVVPEVGCTSATDVGSGEDRKAAWIDTAFDYFAAEAVQFVGWFDADKETDWAVCSQSTTDRRANRRLRGRTWSVYPSFKQSAQRYLGPQP
jgi:mannan endo-1,4-beta-mannosidase